MNPIQIVQSIYEGFQGGGLDAFMDACAPDVVITQDPALPWGGRHIGHDGVADFATRLVGSIDSTVTTEEIFLAGDRVVQQGRSRGSVRHNGATFDVPECHVWTVRDGQVVEAQFYIDSDAMLTALEQ